MQEEKKVKHADSWPMWAKILYWLLAPWVCIPLCLIFTMVVMKSLQAMGVKSNLLDPVAAGTLGFLYFWVLFLIEKIFTHNHHMSWLQYCLGSYILAAFLDLFWLLWYGSRYRADTSDNDAELLYFMFWALALYTAAAFVFRLIEFVIEYIVRKRISKNRQTKVEQYRQLKDKSNK